MPGFDLIVQGYAGVMANEGKLTNGHPEPVWSSSFIDFSTAYSAAGAVMAGLLERSRTGKGQKASTSLLANALAMQSMRLVRIDEMPFKILIKVKLFILFFLYLTFIIFIDFSF